MTVILPAVVAAIFVAVAHFSLLLALAWNVVVLYLTLGFRQFSHYFTDIRDALDAGDEATARERLAEWRHLDASELPRTELLRHVIEHRCSPRTATCSACSSGSCCCRHSASDRQGAILYRMAEFASRYWALQEPHPGHA